MTPPAGGRLTGGVWGSRLPPDGCQDGKNIMPDSLGNYRMNAFIIGGLVKRRAGDWLVLIPSGRF